MPQGNEQEDLRVLLTEFDAATGHIQVAFDHIRDYGDLEHKPSFLQCLTELLEQIDNCRIEVLKISSAHVSEYIKSGVWPPV